MTEEEKRRRDLKAEREFAHQMAETLMESAAKEGRKSYLTKLKSLPEEEGANEIRKFIKDAGFRMLITGSSVSFVTRDRLREMLGDAPDAA
jgi:hypothetical protein